MPTRRRKAKGEKGSGELLEETDVIDDEFVIQQRRSWDGVPLLLSQRHDDAGGQGQIGGRVGVVAAQALGRQLARRKVRRVVVGLLQKVHAAETV